MKIIFVVTLPRTPIPFGHDVICKHMRHMNHFAGYDKKTCPG